MPNIKLNYKYVGIKDGKITENSDVVEEIHDELEEKSKNEEEFLGWLHLPTNYDKKEFERIKKSAEKIKKDSDILLVIGIGGSYLGARAVIEALHSSVYKENDIGTRVIFVGNNLSPNYINDVIEALEGKDFSINVISKSGTTTEPAIAFRIFREILENKYGIDEARSRIYATTDKAKGALKTLAENEGYEQFVVPDNVGGRYSVLTAVGMLPIATAGIDIDKLMEGARIARDRYNDPNVKYNECYQYAVARNILYKLYKNTEIFENNEPKKEARKRIYVTTDKNKGALKTLADSEGYETFVIPDDVGGRFSVLTAVGLLPIAASGLDIEKLMKGAAIAEDKYSDNSLKYNECYKYAVIRNLLYEKDKSLEMLVTYEPKMHFFIEWWKQLFGESEGKDGKGLFPVGAEFTTDLHSLGQYIQEGRRLMFETVLNIEESKTDITINLDEDNLDNLNYLQGKTLSYVNQKAMEGTIKAHTEGGVPNIMINIKKLDEESLGELIYFFEKACAMSAELLEVNPFNQPGVEKYKTNMFKLLKKPGYENK